MHSLMRKAKPARKIVMNHRHNFAMRQAQTLSGDRAVLRSILRPSASISPRIQRQVTSPRGCRQHSLSLTVPSIKKGGPGITWQLANFQCFAPYCRIAKNDTAPAMTVANIRRYKQGLINSMRSDAWLIAKLARYIKRVSSQSKYKAYETWLAKFSKSNQAITVGSVPWIVPSTNIFKNWQAYVKPPTISGSDPFTNWATLIHEQHHQATILSHPHIKQGFAYIETARRKLLTNPNMMTPFDTRLKAMTSAKLPASLAGELTLLYSRAYSAVGTLKALIRNRVRKLGKRAVRKMRILGSIKMLTLYPHLRNDRQIKAVLPKAIKLPRLHRAYSTTQATLRTQLTRQNKLWRGFADNAKAGATEDLKAYCASWTAAKRAIDFINRCCGWGHSKTRAPSRSRTRTPKP